MEAWHLVNACGINSPILCRTVNAAVPLPACDLQPLAQYLKVIQVYQSFLRVTRRGPLHYQQLVRQPELDETSNEKTQRDLVDSTKKEQTSNSQHAIVSWYGFDRSRLSDKWKKATDSFFGPGGGAESVRYPAFESFHLIELINMQFLGKISEITILLVALVSAAPSQLIIIAREPTPLCTNPASIDKARTISLAQERRGLAAPRPATSTRMARVRPRWVKGVVEAYGEDPRAIDALHDGLVAKAQSLLS